MFDILAVGDAIVDKIIAFDENDSMMQQILPVKGLFFIATPEQHNYLRNKPTLSYYAGGSVANTVRNMSLLGFKTAFVGKVGTDTDGDFFEKSLHDYNVQSYLIQTNEDKTGCSVVMVHTDKDRTQCAHSCASNLLTIQEVKDEYLNNAKSVMTEGYMLNRLPELVEDVIHRANRIHKESYFTLSDVHCVANKRELILKLLPEIDILFGNEYEFEALNLNPNTLEKTICVKTCGQQGVDILTSDNHYHFDVQPVYDIVNTNGAGDAFASGFLAGHLAGQTFDECVNNGHRIAKNVLQTELSYLPQK